MKGIVNNIMTSTIISSILLTLAICCISMYFLWPRIKKTILNEAFKDIEEQKNAAIKEKYEILKSANNISTEIINKAKEEALLEKEKSEANLKHIRECISNYDSEYQKYNRLQLYIHTAEQNLKNIHAEIRREEELFDRKKKDNLSKLRLIKNRIKSAQDTLTQYFFDDHYMPPDNLFLESYANKLISFAPSIELPLKSLEYKDLKVMMRQNNKTIKEILEKYETRYKLKANRSIYQLMVIALQAELQNILFNLKFGNLDKSLNAVTEISRKYLTIAADGNQSINPTWLKFIGEIEHLFKEAIKIEYEHYSRQMQIKEEQAALKERMKQEAEERRYLLEQEKKMIKEEEKYIAEIQSIKEKMKAEVEAGTLYLLKQRISELEILLSSVREKKDEIINLQNGKAGFVYIISNLGSFGDDVFKIGMTRRLDPQDRIDELSNASVPFRFDVHSFIFSEDAVSLESELHKRLDSNRVNKITTRKEFFRCNIDDLEKLVYEIQPTASFIKTMLAEQYRMTLQIEKSNSLL